MAGQQLLCGAGQRGRCDKVSRGVPQLAPEEEGAHACARWCGVAAAVGRIPEHSARSLANAATRRPPIGRRTVRGTASCRKARQGMGAACVFWPSLSARGGQLGLPLAAGRHGWCVISKADKGANFGGLAASHTQTPTRPSVRYQRPVAPSGLAGASPLLPSTPTLPACPLPSKPPPDACPGAGPAHLHRPTLQNYRPK